MGLGRCSCVALALVVEASALARPALVRAPAAMRAGRGGALAAEDGDGGADALDAEVVNKGDAFDSVSDVMASRMNFDEDFDEDFEDDLDLNSILGGKGFDMKSMLAGGGFGGDGFDDSLADVAKKSGVAAGYAWTQTKDAITVTIAPLPAGTRARQLSVDFETSSTLRVALAGEDAPRLEGALCGSVARDDTFWTLEENDEDDEDDETMRLVLEIAKAEDSQTMWRGVLPTEGDAAQAKVTERVFFDVDVDGERLGRVEMGLFGAHLPRTVANFAALCRGVEIDGEERSYKGAPFHRIIPGFMVQGGDITAGDGTGGASIYGGTFADEAFAFRHDAEGLLSMANSGPDSNKSQFFLTLGIAPWLDEKHVIFGRVLDGMDVVRKLEALGSDEGGPAATATIADCGVF